MKKYGSAQKKKEQMNKLSSMLCSIGLMLFGLNFLIMALQNWVVLRNWDAGGIKEYQGQYELETKEYWRNTNYKFMLRNGDILEIPCEYVQHGDSLENAQQTEFPHELRFQYSKYKQPVKNTHVAISIVSQNSSITYVEELIMKENMKDEAALYTAFAFLGLGLGFLVIGNLIAGCSISTRRKKRKCQKHR